MIEFDRGLDVREVDPEEYFPRYVRRVTDGEIRTEEPLDRLAAEVADGLRAEVLRGFHGRMVAVEQRDGMTTSAKTVETVVAERFRRVHRLDGGNTQEPAIAKIIPLRRVGLLAQRRHLLMSVRLIEGRLATLIALGVVLVGAIAYVLQALVRSSGEAEIITPGFVLTCAGLALAVLVVQTLTPALKLDPRQNTKIKIAQDIRSYETDDPPAEYTNFIDDLVGELADFTVLRAIIVDDFTKLDRTTRLDWCSRST